MRALPDVAWEHARGQALAEAGITLGGPGICAWSGQHCTETWPFRPSSSFADWSDLAAPASRVAHPGYAWLAGHHREAAGRTLGLRRMSLLASPRGLEAAGKDRKDVVRGWLLHPPPAPFALLVADQGQRHYAWRTPANAGRDRYVVRLDALLVEVDQERWADLLGAVEAAYAQGVPKADIARGETSVGRLARLDVAGRAAWQQVRAARGTGQLALAAWAAQKEEM